MVKEVVARRSFLEKHFPRTEIIAVVASNKPIAQKWTEDDPTRKGDNLADLLDNRTCVISDKHDSESLAWAFSPTISTLLGYPSRPHSLPGSRRQHHTLGIFGI